MPNYVFECGKCESQFEISCPMDVISGLKPECPECGKKDEVYRDFNGIIVSVPKTLGSLAEKNGSKMSEDHKAFLTKKYTEYRNKPFTGTLPEGAKLFDRDSEGKRIPTTKQYSKKRNKNK